MQGESSSASEVASGISFQKHQFTAGVFKFLPVEKVYFGQGSLERLPDETDRLGGRRVLLITGHSLATQTPIIDKAKSMLGDRLQATFTGIHQHAPEKDIEKGLTLALECQIDLIIAIGGGSPIDSAKIIAFKMSGEGKIPPLIAIPTTLSAAEYSYVAGYTEEATRSKTGISDPNLTPRVVILDPNITLWTPQALWLASGIRSIDHAVETLYSPGSHPINDVLALEAIKQLFTYLPSTRSEPDNLDHRLNCQIAAWMSYFAPANAAAHAGMSHMIGKRIGATYGVSHGVTSCILLPHVMRYKASLPGDAARLAPVARVLGLAGDSASDQEATLASANAVENLVQKLGLPKRLSEVNVPETDLEMIAHSSAADVSSRKIILEILKKAY